MTATGDTPTERIPADDPPLPLASRRTVTIPAYAVIIAILLTVLVFIITVYELSGFKSEDNVHTWCDAPTGNRIYIYPNGSGSYVPPESRGNKC